MWKTASLLLTVCLILATFGIVMLASTSMVMISLNDPVYYLKKQAIWLFLSLIAFFIFSRYIDYHYLRTFAVPLSIFTLFLLVAVFIPGIGRTIKGSSRWLKIAGFNFQPTEMAKLSTILILSWWLCRTQRWVKTFAWGVLVPVIFLGLELLLILLEPDFGTTLLIAAVGFIILFLGGSHIGYLMLFGTVGLSGISFLIMHNPERMDRFLAFLNPEKYAKTDAYQLIQALYAFISGGITGVGFGESLQKHGYLPEAHTDFILPIIGEELGLAATMAVLFLFLLLFLCSWRISFQAPDLFGKLIGFGITMTITLQAIINIGVVTGCLPTKGIPLPFISFGGSSLLMSFIMIGILINISRHGIHGSDDQKIKTIKNAARRL